MRDAGVEEMRGIGGRHISRGQVGKAGKRAKEETGRQRGVEI